MTGSEEELEQRKKDRQKKKEGEGTEDGEETLQLDAADSGEQVVLGRVKRGLVRVLDFGNSLNSRHLSRAKKNGFPM